MLANHPALVLDIETDKLPNAADYLDPVEPDKRLTDPAKIEISRIEKTKARDERLSLDWNVGHIVALGTCTADGPQVLTCPTEYEEAEALIWFWLTAREHTLVGFNIKGFDLRYIIQRSRYLGIAHPALDLGKYSKRGIVDLFLELTFNEGHYDQGAMRHTLKAFCARFGIACDDPVTGTDIPALVAAENWDAIEAHCLSDLRLTVELARCLGVLTEGWCDGTPARVRRLENSSP